MPFRKNPSEMAFYLHFLILTFSIDTLASSGPTFQIIGVFSMQRSSSTHFVDEVANTHPCFLPAHEWLMPKDRGYHVEGHTYPQGLDVLAYANQHYNTVMDQHCPSECSGRCIMIIKFFNHHVKSFSLYTNLLLSPKVIPVVLRRHNDTEHACSTFYSHETHDFHATPLEDGYVCPQVSAHRLETFTSNKNKWYGFLEHTLRPRMSLTLSFEANTKPEELEVTKTMLLRLANFDLTPPSRS